MKFGSELAQARAQRDMTQADLAKLIGKRQPHVARLEAGEHEPNLAYLRAIAHAIDGEIVIRPDGAVEIRLANNT